jgi:hypothetical protein
MSFYTCFDWLKKLRLFVNERNLRTDKHYAKDIDFASVSDLEIFQITRRRNRTVGGFATTYTINICHHESCKFESRSWRGVLDRALCETVSQ